MTVRNDHPDTAQNRWRPARTHGVVLVGCDGSTSGQPAVDFAIRESALRHATVIAVSAFVLPDHAYRAVAGTTGEALIAKLSKVAHDSARKALDLALTRADTPDVEIELNVVVGHPSQMLLAASAGADLLVVGARGMGGWSRMVLGSVSTEVVHRAHLPVVVVPATPLVR